MRFISEYKLYSNKKFTKFLPQKHFSPGIQLKIIIGDLDLLNPEIKINGRITFYHLLPGKERFRKDYSICKEDFFNGPCIFEINTGDLVSKVSTILYFKLPNGVNSSIRHELSEATLFPKLENVNLNGHALDFIQNIRALSPQNFIQLISRDLEALETTISMGSQQTFKKWAIANQIIRLAGCGMIPLSFIDLAVERYLYPYAKTKERLGTNEIVL